MREIIGNTTATPNPQSDWNQTDATKADYIKNKPFNLSDGDNKTLRSYGGKWYAVYPSLFAPQDTWYKGKTAKNAIQKINIVDSYAPTGDELETWNGDVDNIGFIKCYVSTEELLPKFEKFMIDILKDHSAYPLVKGSTYDKATMSKFGLFAYYGANNIMLDQDTWGECRLTFSRDQYGVTLGCSNPGGGSTFLKVEGRDVVFTIDEVRTGVWEMFYHIIDDAGNLITEGNFYDVVRADETGNIHHFSYLKNDQVVDTLPDGHTIGEIEGETVTALIIAGNGYGKLSCHMDSSKLFYNFKGLTAINGAELLDTSAATTMKAMFGNDNALYTVDVGTWDTSNVTNMNSIFGNCYVLESADVSTWNTSNVTDMGTMFQNCRGIRSLNTSGWNTSKNTTFRNTFKGCTDLMSVDVSNFDTSNATTMYGMFSGDSNLTSLDVSNWNTEKVESLTSTFTGCSALTHLDVSKWNVGKVTDMDSTFANCTFTTLDVSNWDVSNVTNMRCMFIGCNTLTTLDVSRWNVGKVTNMGSMFCTCTGQNAADGKLAALDVSKWSPASLENADSMFYGNGELTSLDLRNWDINNVKSMSHMFCDCRKLSDIKLDGLVAASCISFDGMFNDCRALVTIDLTGFVTATAQEFSQMFEGCTSLTEIKGINTFDTTSAKTYEEMFQGCESLEILDLSAFVTQNLATGTHYGRDGQTYERMTNMFTNMPKLMQVTLGNNFWIYDDAYFAVNGQYWVCPDGIQRNCWDMKADLEYQGKPVSAAWAGVYTNTAVINTL